MYLLQESHLVRFDQVEGHQGIDYWTDGKEATEYLGNVMGVNMKIDRKDDELPGANVE